MFTKSVVDDVSAAIQRVLVRAGPRIVVGVSGAQGSGKSTLAVELRDFISRRGIRSVVISLDDFYLTRSERQELSEQVNPLVRTRGVPGTHDMNTLRSTIEQLLHAQNTTIEWPRFSKAKDDRDGINEFQTPDPVTPLVVLIEGWCIGCLPLDEIETPMNDLERFEDRDLTWRRYVDEAITTSYVPLWSKLNLFIFLQVPDWESVLRWRTQQAMGNHEDMSQLNLSRFIQFFERISEQMRSPTGRWRTDVLIKLAHDHSVARLSYL